MADQADGRGEQTGGGREHLMRVLRAAADSAGHSFSGTGDTMTETLQLYALWALSAVGIAGACLAWWLM